jgi:hypothetical protein
MALLYVCLCIPLLNPLEVIDQLKVLVSMVELNKIISIGKEGHIIEFVIGRGSTLCGG